MLSGTGDKAAMTFFGSAMVTMGSRPDRVTTDEYSSYPGATHSVLERGLAPHPRYLNNRLEQDHRGIKGRIRYMRCSKSHPTSNVPDTIAIRSSLPHLADLDVEGAELCPTSWSLPERLRSSFCVT